MRQKLAIFFTIQFVAFIAFFIISFKYGGSETLSALAEYAPNVLLHNSLGLAFSSIVAIILFSPLNLSTTSKLAIFSGQLMLSIYAIFFGFGTILFLPFQAYYSYKYWRQANA